MKRINRWIAAVLTAGVAATLFPAAGAHASSEGRRNTAWAATAAAGYLTYKYAQKPSTGRLVPAVAAAGAAGWAWHKYGTKRQDEREAQRDRERSRWVSYGRHTAQSSHRTAGYRGSHSNHGRRVGRR